MSVNQRDVLHDGVLYGKGLPTDLRVKPHVQAFADELRRRFTVKQISTYPSHDPTPDLALDVFAAPDVMRAIANWACTPEVFARFNVDYGIANLDHKGPGDIWNPPDWPYWRVMKDRGGITQNHIDHDHFSFLATAPPQPILEEDDMNLYLVRPAERNEVFLVGKAKAIHIKSEKEVEDLKKGFGIEKVVVTSQSVARWLGCDW